MMDTMPRMPGRLIAAIAEVVFAATAGSVALAQAFPQIVEVEGVGAVRYDDQAAARDEALRDAYRRALEAAGVRITALTEFRNFQVFYDQILTRAEGYVRRWRILHERRDGDLYRVWISAEVALGTARGDQDALNVLIELMGNPSVMVLLRADRWYPYGDIAESELAGQLADAGYHIVDTAQSERIRHDDVVRQLYLSGDRQAAIALGIRTGADLFVVGRLDLQNLGSVSLGAVWLHSVSAVMSYKVLAAATGQTLLAGSAQAAGPDVTWEGAGTEAARNVGRALGRSLAWEIPRRFSPTLGEGRTLQLIVVGADYALLTRLVAILKTQRGVEGRVYLRSFDGQVAVVDLKTNQSMDNLLARLKGERSLQVVIIAASATRAEIRVSP
jgi:hypothetical protein